MNKNIKRLLIAGSLSLGMLFTVPDKSDALSYMYTSSNVNLRQYAGTYSRKLGTVPRGSKIAVYGSYGNWYSIRYNGKWGYVCKDYVRSNVSNKVTTSQTTSQKTSNKGQVLNKLIIVNTYYNQVYLYQNGRLVWSRPCASGKASTPTPTGSFTIVEKIKNRPYYKGGIPGGSPNNPLGKYWLGIGNAYALHGNSNESSIGKHVSGGCVRLHNWDIQDLYNRVGVGTKVLISNKSSNNSTIASWYGYKVY